jgi:hypothetical protein
MDVREQLLVGKNDRDLAKLTFSARMQARPQ